MVTYIYITTNKVNGKRYIGQKTSPVFLGNKYLGSGEALNNAINKYGSASFEVAVLEECNSRHELNIREAYYISKFNAVEDESFYNLKEGGHGGSVKGQCKHSQEFKDKMQDRMRGCNNPNYGSHTNHWTPESFEIMRSKNSGVNNPRFGTKHTDETKLKIANKAIGRMWITNSMISKRIYLEEFNQYEKIGFYAGRVMNK